MQQARLSDHQSMISSEKPRARDFIRRKKVVISVDLAAVVHLSWPATSDYRLGKNWDGFL